MAEQTNIAWTDSTFNPWIGCTKVSPACDNCYAEALMDKRWHKVQWGSGKARTRTSAANWQQPLLWERTHGKFMRAHGRRRRVFCASLADVFDNEAPPEWRGDLWAIVKATPHLDWLILTKRIGNARGMAPADGLPPNVWLGATIANQEEANRDVPKLLTTPATIRFLSVEPMLGPIDLHRGGWSFMEALRPPSGNRNGWERGIDWVIVGGESGNSARPINPDWVRALRNQCIGAGVPFFFKQWGGTRPDANGCELDGVEVKQWPVGSRA